MKRIFAPISLCVAVMAAVSKDEIVDMINRSQPSILTIRAIQQFGIAFEPTDDVLDQLQRAGGDDALLAAVLKAGRPEVNSPLAEGELLALVGKGVPGESIVKSVRRHGIDFQASQDFLSKLRVLGAKDFVIDELHMTAPRPYGKDELVRALSAYKDVAEIEQGVRQRGIDFEPNEASLSALRATGASQTLMQTVHGAKVSKPFEPQFTEFSPPKPNVTSSSWAGKESTLICAPSDLIISVLADPNELGKTVGTLHCGDRVTFLEKDSGHVGIDKIRYADGKVGYLPDHYLSGMTNASPYPPPRGMQAPVPTYKPDPPYTPEARRAKIQGTVSLSFVVDEQGNVTEVKETSQPLGYGLDEMAMRVVKTWKFRPGSRAGIPVPVPITAQIAFRLR